MLRPALIGALALPLAIGAQERVASTKSASNDTTSARALVARGTATAVRAPAAPVLDGKADDAVWATAAEIDDFKQFEPTEGGTPRYRTTARVAYDDRYIYVHLRAHDPHPDSIVAQLSRRDMGTPSDWLMVLIDSYNDRRTGFEFHVNPAGVKRDASIINDGEEDLSWDAVWDVATAREQDGWSAEFRIPLSQLRFPPNGAPAFGMMFMRTVGRSNERVAWPLFSRTKGGLVSQFAEVSGFAGLESPRRLEVTPYTVAKSTPQAVKGLDGATTGYGRASLATMGADIKYGVTSNLTLDATINPDFGQVEADPANLNLTAFEQFYAERRPFFMEGAGLFRFDINCNDGSCSGLFYSRRIGRSPQLNDEVRYGMDPAASTSSATPILGAAKLTGRTASGFQVALLNAVTDERKAYGPEIGEVVTEPRTNYAVARVRQDFRKGMSAIGLMATGVNRSLDEFTEPRLRRSAYALGVDGRHRFLENKYEVSGWLAGSRVAGSEEAIDRTQRSSARYYQREGSEIEYDPTRTSLEGTAGMVSLNKVSGVVRFNSNYRYLAPGFEINDIGYLPRVDEQLVSNWVGLNYNKATSWYRMARLNFNQWASWNTAGLRREIGGNVNYHVQLPSMIWIHAGISGNGLLPVYDDRQARGGPEIRQSRSGNFWLGAEGDRRDRVTPNLFVGGMQGDEGASKGFWVDNWYDVRITDNVKLQINPYFEYNINDNQWAGRFDIRDRSAGANDSLLSRHYGFARLSQKTLSMSTRIDYTVTPTLTVQLYARPYATAGEYRNLRELDDPSAGNYADRLRPFTPVNPTDASEYANYSVTGNNFNYKALNTNAVLRWEYRP
ncbi:MAG TPA: DUF5916 domain-containing protein, partial [Gemmatimonadaceae bacterium]|nr:DUF5916 domain-containing protein [Gemmatimonadaceae bacterium]